MPATYVERRHDGRDAGLHRGLEWRQIRLRQLPFRYVDRAVVAPGLDRAVSAEMFRRRCDALAPRQVRALIAVDLGLGEAARDISVLARAFRNAAPTRVAADVKHRRERHAATPARPVSSTDILAVRSHRSGSKAQASAIGSG